MKGLLEILVVLPLFVLAWGWVVLGAIAVFRIATVRGATRQMRRVVVAICMIVAAMCWARLVQPFTWGVDEQTIQTQGGKIEATIRYEGFRSNRLVIRRDGKEQSVQLPGGRPVRIFWIQQGKTIGVDLNNRHMIVDIEILGDTTINDRKLSPEEERRLDYQRKLTPEEEKAFEAAEKAAEVQ